MDQKTYWERRNNTVEIKTKDQKGKEVTERQPKPLRGQDTLPRPSVAKWTETDFEAGKCKKEEVGQERLPKKMEWRMDKKEGLIAYPRRDRRRKIVDRNFTKEGYRAIFINGKAEGAVKIGGRQSNMYNHHLDKAEAKELAEAQALGLREAPIDHRPPKHDPALSNHDRMTINKADRAFKREQAMKLKKQRLDNVRIGTAGS
jgi:hypothetical protein